MIKDIITNQTEPNQVLYEKCSPVDFDNKFQLIDDEYVARVVTDLIDTAESVRKNCLGLSANQIGYPLRVFVFRTKEGGPFVPVVNPKIIRAGGGIKAMYEQCHSRVDKDGRFLPGIRMRRSKVIGVEYVDVLLLAKIRKGECEKGASATVRLELKGLHARTFLHELDHLNGKEI
jgi:peptide deformylase